jgi:hypothetical protein
MSDEKSEYLNEKLNPYRGDVYELDHLEQVGTYLDVPVFEITTKLVKPLISSRFDSFVKKLKKKPEPNAYIKFKEDLWAVHVNGLEENLVSSQILDETHYIPIKKRNSSRKSSVSSVPKTSIPISSRKNEVDNMIQEITKNIKKELQWEEKLRKQSHDLDMRLAKLNSANEYNLKIKKLEFLLDEFRRKSKNMVILDKDLLMKMNQVELDILDNIKKLEKERDLNFGIRLKNLNTEPKPRKTRKSKSKSKLKSKKKRKILYI